MLTLLLELAYLSVASAPIEAAIPLIVETGRGLHSR